MLIIVFAQFAGTSLWFAGNAIMGELTAVFHFTEGATGNLTSMVQFGFIFGTLVFAFLAFADRFSPVKLFLLCSVFGAFFNSLIVFLPLGKESIMIYRFFTGFFLSGIYPVGMKISADWFKGSLGRALGYLVGALVLGSALPYLIKFAGAKFLWPFVILSTSVLAILGGLLLFFLVPDGPFRTKGVQFNLSAILEVFKVKDFRLASFGYFGHMWELYAFWAFIPFIVNHYNEINGQQMNVSLWSFLIIASGFIGCTLGGHLSLKFGSGKVAFLQLFISFTCCLISPMLYHFPQSIFIFMMIVWGIAVVGDSPQYSTLSAITAPKEWIGSALTIMNCIGFTVTIFSIQLIKYLEIYFGIQFALIWLAPGPLLGLFSLFLLMRRNKQMG